MDQHFQQNRTKYLVITGVILLGGSYLIFRKYKEESAQRLADAQSDTYTITDVADTSDTKHNEHKSIDNDKTNKTVSSTHKFPIQVFVRMRPLVGREIEEKHEEMEYIVKPFTFTKTGKKKEKKTKKGNKDKVSRSLSMITLNNVSGRKMDRSKDYKGFEAIILPGDDNIKTFNTCIKPSLENIVNGDSTCVFAYGHTGSGKSHTIFGYKGHPGMYQQFATCLCNHFFVKTDQNDKEKDIYHDLMVEVRFTGMIK